MSTDKGQSSKARLHINNKNRERYDLAALIIAVPALKEYIQPNKRGEDSIDFSKPEAVKLLNEALLNHYYGIKSWDFPTENLCPPIPGRADYIHYMADILKGNNYGKLPIGKKITGLDIGVGASAIYPIIGVTEYDWNFIASDIDEASIAAVNKITAANPTLTGRITAKVQSDTNHFFEGIVEAEDKIDFTICNPPFHASLEKAQEGSRRKVKNLTGKTEETPTLNFAGTANELVYEDGGESGFIQKMITESKQFGKQCFWFSTLVSKQSNLKGIYKALDRNGAVKERTITMGTGNKSTRIIAWTFLSTEEQKEWVETRWKEPKAEKK